MIGAGTTTITATQAGTAIYLAATNVSQPLIVEGYPPVITSEFENQTVYANASATFSVTATGTAPLFYQWRKDDLDLAGATAAALVLNKAQTNQAGDYTVVITNVAGSVTSGVVALSVNRLAQTITFGALPGKRAGDSPFILNATASSGLPVSFSSSDPSAASLNGSTGTLIGNGSSTITAIQAGTAAYLPAKNVSQLLIVGGTPGSLATQPKETSGRPGLVLIPAGAFTMGNSVSADTDITNATSVTATLAAFYMDVNLVSLSQWQAVYAHATNHGYGFAHAGSGKAANHPVQRVDWYDCVKWCNARSEQAGKTPVYYTDEGCTQVYRTGEMPVHPSWAAKGFRLPTEAEWEKAARGGLSGKRFPWGDTIWKSQASYYGNTGYSYDFGPDGYHTTYASGDDPYTSPVGSFAPNGYGLHDMTGNVWEWCSDWYGTPYAGGDNPRGAGSGSIRVIRGGCWGINAIYGRTAFRNGNTPISAYGSLGFRCVLPSGP